MSELTHNSNQHAWRTHEQRLLTLVENASDVLTVVAPDLTIVFQTASGASLLGYQAEDLEGTKFGALVDPDGLSRLRVACAQAADGVAGHPVQVRLARQDGSWIDGETVVRYEPEERCLILITRDVRQRLEADLQLRRRAAQQAVVVRLGAQALAAQELSALMLAASSELASALAADYAGVLEYQPACDVFMPGAGIGMQPYGPPGTPVGISVRSPD